MDGDTEITPAPHPPPFRLRVSLCSLATPRQAKNICEIYGPTGYIRTLYTYSRRRQGLESHT